MRKISKNPKIKEPSAEQIAELKENAAGILAECRRKLVNGFPFIGSIAMNLEIVPVRDVRLSTAATDGSKIFFDIDFLSQLSPEEQLFVFAHEVWHNVMCHFTRTEGRDPQQFNIATDLEVNQLLVKDGLIIPKDCMMPAKFNFPEDQSAEQYYELLLKKQKKQQQNSNSQSQSSGSGGSAGQAGSESDNRKASNKSSDKLTSQFDEHIREGDQQEEAKEGAYQIEDKYGKVGFDSDYNPSVSKDAAEKMREAAVSAAQSVERTRGELPAHIASIVKDLLTPEVDWKEVLSQFVTQGIGDKRVWNPPNRRHIWHDSYLQRRRGEKLKLGVIVDTSGSTSQDLPKFLTELNSIVKTFGNYELTVIHCDAAVQQVDQYDDCNQLDPETQEFEFKGGGGTQLQPAFDYIADNELDIDSVVCFTDGYCEEFPADSQMQYPPTLWVISEKNNKAENLKMGEKVWFKNTAE